MRRTCLVISLCSLLFVLSCAQRKALVDGVTRATPRFQIADARSWPDEVLPEDAGAWPEEPPSESLKITLMSDGAGDEPPYIEAYTDKKSYLPGDTINFHVSTTAETFRIDILREGWSREYVGRALALPGQYHPIPPSDERPWAEGAKWPVTYSWVVPDEWENGNYLALLRTTSGEYKYTYHPFIVRSRKPGASSKVAFVMNYNTRHAYNEWGGKSLYFSRVPGDSKHSTAVSFLRPFDTSSGRGKGYWGQWELTSQLKEDGFSPEFVTEWDISSDPTIIMAYDVLVFSGHHEYISRNTYDALEAHHARGGHLAFFSGNDIYWQVRFEDDGDKMIGYKNYATAHDPVYNVDNSLLTALWASELVNRPAEALQGVYYQEYSQYFEAEDFIVQDPEHFILEGTGLKQGDAFGHEVASGETDYIQEASPASMDIILLSRRTRPRPGYADYVKVEHSDCAAVYYEDNATYGFPGGNGGQVFSAGTHMGWGENLLKSSPGREVVRRATKNIIQHMVDAPKPKPDYQDLATATSHWLGQCDSPGWCQYADINMDGVVNIADFAYLAEDWSRE